MSKRTSGDFSSTIEVPDPNNLESGDDEEEVFEGSELDSAVDDTPAIGGDDFMHTDDFRRLFVGFVMVDTLVTMRWLDRKWHKVVEKMLTELEDEPFGEIIVHGGNDIDIYEAESAMRMDRMEQVTKVVFLLNVTKVGDDACRFASIFVAVDIPEGITSIGIGSFQDCTSLEDIKFPKSLTNIGEMKVPDSLQKLGYNVFHNCSELVPSTIDVDNKNAVVTYLRSIQ
ncbi:hypothetical protein TrST_g861 [Triparma strigata]|uniref:Uncharacterized protein n=1 Tax=Triparma strigata TaxID=1606541 RepID=A0A9W7ELP6_9STRA|nr:hypothetical protein TrST_g861 [Triparma strigata]